MKKKSFFLRCIKTVPIIMSLIITLYIVIHKYPNSKSYINDISGSSVITTVVLYSASSELGFCNLHRTFIVHNFIGTLWVDIKFIFIKEFCILINILYVFVFIILLIKLYKKVKASHS